MSKYKKLPKAEKAARQGRAEMKATEDKACVQCGHEYFHWSRSCGA